jgi:spermidine synthase
VIVAVAGALVPRSHAALRERFSVLYESENHYGRLRVIDDHRMSIRWLMADSSLISAVRPNDPRPVFDYLNLAEALLGFAPSAKDALVIGLGAGHVPRVLEGYGLNVDSIEINPEVVRAAREYFQFAPKGRVVIGDARYELRRLEGNYDLMVRDCFSGGTVPAHVLSLEMMKEIRAHLRKGGLLITSFFGDSSGENARATKTISKTLRSIFPNVRVFSPRPGTQPIDLAFVASDLPIAFDPGFPSRCRGPEAVSYAERIEKLEVELGDGDPEIATDDKNPLELWQARRADLYRDFLVEKLGVDAFL